jgi:hypothetical protein
MRPVPNAPPATEEVRTVEELAQARALQECLEAMEQGETDLDKLAGRYPEARDEIRPLIEIALRLRRRRERSVLLSVQFREELRERLMSRRSAV